jgi:cell division protease FtsH
MVIQLLERETLNKEEIAEIFAKVKTRPNRPAWTGSATRIPSAQPPVEIPERVAPERTDAPRKTRRVKKATSSD